LVEFQRVYAQNTQDHAPGNRHYSEWLMRVVAQASAALALVPPAGQGEK
jgi:hypothetical protein